MKRILGLLALAIVGCSSSKTVGKKYEPTWESLANHEAAPEWLEDAKLGIYFHWGPYAVPAFGSEWYPRWMFSRTIRSVSTTCQPMARRPSLAIMTL